MLDHDAKAIEFKSLQDEWRVSVLYQQLCEALFLEVNETRLSRGQRRVRVERFWLRRPSRRKSGVLNLAKLLSWYHRTTGVRLLAIEEMPPAHTGLGCSGVRKSGDSRPNGVKTRPSRERNRESTLELFPDEDTSQHIDTEQKNSRPRREVAYLKPVDAIRVGSAHAGLIHGKCAEVGNTDDNQLDFSQPVVHTQVYSNDIFNDRGSTDSVPDSALVTACEGEMAPKRVIDECDDDGGRFRESKGKECTDATRMHDNEHKQAKADKKMESGNTGIITITSQDGPVGSSHILTSTPPHTHTHTHGPSKELPMDSNPPKATQSQKIRLVPSVSKGQVQQDPIIDGSHSHTHSHQLETNPSEPKAGDATHSVESKINTKTKTKSQDDYGIHAVNPIATHQPHPVIEHQHTDSVLESVVCVVSKDTHPQGQGTTQTQSHANEDVHLEVKNQQHRQHLEQERQKAREQAETEARVAQAQLQKAQQEMVQQQAALRAERERVQRATEELEAERKRVKMAAEKLASQQRAVDDTRVAMSHPPNSSGRLSASDQGITSPPNSAVGGLPPPPPPPGLGLPLPPMMSAEDSQKSLDPLKALRAKRRKNKGMNGKNGKGKRPKGRHKRAATMADIISAIKLGPRLKKTAGRGFGGRAGTGSDPGDPPDAYPHGRGRSPTLQDEMKSVLRARNVKRKKKKKKTLSKTPQSSTDKQLGGESVEGKAPRTHIPEQTSQSTARIKLRRTRRNKARGSRRNEGALGGDVGGGVGGGGSGTARSKSPFGAKLRKTRRERDAGRDRARSATPASRRKLVDSPFGPRIKFKKRKQRRPRE